MNSSTYAAIHSVLARRRISSAVEYGFPETLEDSRPEDERLCHRPCRPSPVRAEAAILLDSRPEDFDQWMWRTFSAAEQLAVVWEPEQHAPNRITDWVELCRVDFARSERIQCSGGALHVFERKRPIHHGLPGHLVVSLTSYPARFPTLAYTLRRVLLQTIRPDEVVLWVAPDDADRLPREVTDLCNHGLTIRLTEDTRSYKKIIPALLAYPDSFIITLDDDQIYPADTLEPLVANYRSGKEILCRRAHLVSYGPGGKPLPYLQWQMEVPEGTAHPDLFPTSGAGVLYPPRSLDPRATDKALFTRLAPHADDIWLYWMARLAGATARVVGHTWQNMVWPGSQSSSLMTVNWNGGNDRQIAAMHDHFGRPGTAIIPAAAVPQAEAPSTFDSAGYWSRRYATGGNSGAGSYGRLAQFKAEVINDFVARNDVDSVIEFGSGDGAQLSLAVYPRYIGFDVAVPSLEMCRRRFGTDATKSFRHTDEYSGEAALLTLSLDVIYHLIEDGVFHGYMTRLFDASRRFVIVYSSNEDRPGTSVHVRHRRFTDWVDRHRSDFRLVQHIPNRHPLRDDAQTESFADFYVFERQALELPAPVPAQAARTATQISVQ